MMSVKVTSNIKQFSKQMSKFAKQQLPYVASRTLNTCAKHVRQDAINNTFKQGFATANASRFAKGVLRMKFSNKKDYYRGRLQSSVLDVTGKEYLVTHQEGGTRRPRSGQFIAVPSRDTKRKSVEDKRILNMARKLANKILAEKKKASKRKASKKKAPKRKASKKNKK